MYTYIDTYACTWLYAGMYYDIQIELYTYIDSQAFTWLYARIYYDILIEYNPIVYYNMYWSWNISKDIFDDYKIYYVCVLVYDWYVSRFIWFMMGILNKLFRVKKIVIG